MNAMKSLRNKFSSTNLALVWFFLLEIIFFSIVSSTFRSNANLRNILTDYSHIGIVAVGMTFPLLLGGIDLSQIASHLMLRCCASLYFLVDAATSFLATASRF